MKIAIPIAALLLLVACSGATPTAPGTYDLDIGDRIDAMEAKWRVDMASMGKPVSDSPSDMGNRMLAMLRSISAQLVLKDDNTFQITMYSKDVKRGAGVGKWSLDGAILTMTGTRIDGTEVTNNGVLKSDGIEFSNGVSDIHGEVFFRRK